MKILIAIPCYNCEKQILRVIQKLRTVVTYDVLFVDNKSTDDTAKVITENLEANHVLLQHEENYGLGGSFRSICQYASERNYDCFILFHGDDQASVEDLVNMVEIYKSDFYDCIFGARFMPASQRHGYSQVRTFGNEIINSIYSFALGKRIYEIGSGLNLYRISTLPLDEIKRYPSHMAFDINLLFHYVQGPYRYRFMPIRWSEEDQVSNARNIRVGLTVLHMLLKHLAGVKDLSTTVQQQNFRMIKR